MSAGTSRADRRLRVGIAPVYAWRPHAEHGHYLASLLRDAGDHVSVLSCDGALRDCYNLEAKAGRSRAAVCAMCTVGGIRSWERHAVSIRSLHAARSRLDVATARTWAEPSASTLARLESDEDYASGAFASAAARVAMGVADAYDAAMAWIEREHLDAIVLFNGRMDATRAIAEAARASGISYVSYERTWFGDGLLMLPDESCIGLRETDRVIGDWLDVPLTEEQARRSAALVAARFLRRNQNEWRAYNTTASESRWPLRGERRVILVPGSRNEIWGHPDWVSGWAQRTDAFDAVIDHLGLRPDEVILRNHPNWATTIHGRTGDRPEAHYTDWAHARGITVIGAAEPTSTLALIDQCDAVVVNGGSAALEAGILGKQVIAVGPSVYQRAGFQDTVYGPEDLGELKLDASPTALATRARQTLRFGYTMNHRLPQFVDHVRAVTPTSYRYAPGADPQRLHRLVLTGAVEADDPRRANGRDGEDRILADIAARQWEGLFRRPGSADDNTSPAAALPRRLGFRPIDRVRDRLPKGDL